MDITSGKRGTGTARGPIVGNRRTRKQPVDAAFWGRNVGPVRVPAVDLAEDPFPPAAASREAGGRAADRLGVPLAIDSVAQLIGCSPWTVRQKLIPQGLPVFRSGASGKLIFYTNQVVRWIERQQQGGF